MSKKRNHLPSNSEISTLLDGYLGYSYIVVEVGIIGQVGTERDKHV